MNSSTTCLFEFPNVWSSPKSEVGNAEEEESNEKRDWKLNGSFRSVEEIETTEKEGEFGDGNANGGERKSNSLNSIFTPQSQSYKINFVLKNDCISKKITAACN